eukprot:m.125397 g.125397  ORF g.125397 m.125397 type:complete len:205 (-) comp12979_c2_seq3:778-1392(-)
MTGLWTTLQSFTGAAMGTFASLHFTNNLVAPLGADIYNNIMLGVSEVYKNPIFEMVGLGAVLVHIISGWNSPQPKEETSSMHFLSRLSGYGLAALLGFHVFQMRIQPHLQNISVDFNFVSRTFNKGEPFVFLFYNVFFQFGLFHAAYGTARILRRIKFPKACEPNSSSLFLVVVALLSVGGVLTCLEFSKPAPFSVSTLLNKRM